MSRSTVTSKGRITIPKEIRNEMRLKAGDCVEFTVGRSGKMTLKAMSMDFRSLRGILKSPLNRPISLKETDEAIARGACRG